MAIWYQKGRVHRHKLIKIKATTQVYYRAVPMIRIAIEESRKYDARRERRAQGQIRSWFPDENKHSCGSAQ